VANRKIVYKSDYGAGDTYGSYNHTGSSVFIVNPQGTIGFTPEGGLAIRLINKTGANSIKGTVVHPISGTLNPIGSFDTSDVNDVDPIGAIYESGVPDGSPCFIVTAGVAEVLVENGSTGSIGGWYKVSSSTPGRAVMAVHAAGIPALQDSVHFMELGHGMQNHESGSEVLTKIIMHFN